MKTHTKDSNRTKEKKKRGRREERISHLPFRIKEKLYIVKVRKRQRQRAREKGHQFLVGCAMSGGLEIWKGEKKGQEKVKNNETIEFPRIPRDAGDGGVEAGVADEVPVPGDDGGVVGQGGDASSEAAGVRASGGGDCAGRAELGVAEAVAADGLGASAGGADREAGDGTRCGESWDGGACC